MCLSPLANSALLLLSAFATFTGAFTMPATSKITSTALFASADFPSITTAARTMLKPAAGHSQPLWGPQDPYLSAGTSIAPSAQSLADMDVAPVDTSALAEPANTAASNGWHILDSSRITAENLLPGFSPARGILPFHSPNVPAETPESFAAQVEWSAKFLNVIDNLPTVAFAYALVEFFLLRPNLDLYQEEIRQEPSEVMTATVAVTGVRVAVDAVGVAMVA